DRHVVSAGGADLDAIEAQNTRSVRGRIRGARRVAVIGEDQKLESDAGRRCGDVVRGAETVRAIGVDVQHAWNRAVAPRRVEREWLWRKLDEGENGNGGREGRRWPQKTLHKKCVGLHPGRRFERGRLVGALPGELRLGSSKVSEG